jgi:uncharacterized protein (TIGR01777 family)
MKYKKIILAGGNGYLGNVLADYYSDKAEEILILSRHAKETINNIKTIVWDGKTAGDWIPSLEGADLLINLCGKNVNCRYTRKNKAEIVTSRVKPTLLLAMAVNNLQHPPELWINVTSATIYRHAEDRPQNETTGELGNGFSVDVCRQWEAAFFNAATTYTRKIALRMAIVLGARDGAFPRLNNLVELRMGGRQGNGKQLISWVHEHDAARTTEWLLEHKNLEGIINCTAPTAINNFDFMRTIRKACRVSFGLPAPKWLLEIGAAVIGTETELILKSRWVEPKRLMESGFKFAFSRAEDAVKEILAEKKSVNTNVTAIDEVIAR